MQPRHYYTFFMLLAAGVFVLTRLAMPRSPRLSRLPWWKRLTLVLAAFVGGALGAKLPFVFASAGGVLDSMSWIADGKTITTGLAGAYLGVELTKWLLDIRVKTGDTFALPLALALAVGRLGCFFNGCCYGLPTKLPWGVDFGDGSARQPTQLYEVLFHLTMAAILWMLQRRDLLPNQRLKLYLIAYGIFRFLTEYLRPEPPGWLGLTFYQWVSLVAIAALSWQWWFDWRQMQSEVLLTAAQPM